jgi:hypothetical protein
VEETKNGERAKEYEKTKNRERKASRSLNPANYNFLRRVITMNDLKKIEMSKLVFDYTVYPRHKISEFNVNDLLRVLQSGGELSPITWDNKTRIIIDGFHRVTALKKYHGNDNDIKIAGYEIDCKDKGEMLLKSTELNSKHGLKLSEWDKARCLTLAKEFKVSEELMREVLAIPQERVKKLKERIVEVRNKSGKVIRHTQLKRGQDDLAKKKDGKYVTEEQAEIIEGDKSTGMNIYSRVNTIITDLENGIIKREDKYIELIEKLVFAANEWLRG